MIRWGVLSTAKIGRTQLLPAIGVASNARLEAVASRSHDKAQALAAQFAAPLVFGSYEEMLASDQIDAIYIPLPTSQHVEWTLKAAKAGKHILCEKPIALKAEEIDALIAARDKHHVVISEAFMVHYHPQWHKVRALIADGAIGRLRHVQGVFTYFNTDPKNMRNDPALGGGGLPDIGVYPVVTTRLATGQEPNSVRASVEISKEFGTDIYAQAVCSFDGFDLSFYVSTQMGLRQFMVFHGEEGSIEVPAPFNPPDYGQAELYLYNQDRSNCEIFRFPGVAQYRLQVEAFGEAVQGGAANIFTLESSKRNQLVIDAIYQAGQTGNKIDIG